MKIEIMIDPVFWLHLTREDLEPLFILAEHHYDGACSAAARQGGFLYGWRNRVSAYVPEDAEPVPCSASRRDLDTVLKICEGVRMATSCKLLTPEQATRVNHLCAMFLTAMGAATQAAHDFPIIYVNGPTLQAGLQWATAPGRF